MKLFLDSVNLAEIKMFAATGIIDGITTNPSLLSREKGDLTELIRSICAVLPHGEISVEVTEEQSDRIYKQAHEIAKIAPNVVVKIPFALSYLSLMKQLIGEGIRINVTLIFSTLQALAVCKIGVHMISPFVGRLDDINTDGTVILHELRAMIDQCGYSTQILAASLRHVRHLQEALSAGADIATVPVEVLKKALEHPLTQQGIEKFAFDWHKAGVKQFP